MSINDLFFKYYTYIYGVFYNSPNYKMNVKNIKLYTSRLEGFKKRLSKKAGKSKTNRKRKIASWLLVCQSNGFWDV